jgi:DNA repair protein RecO (recombination protein O)
MNQQTTGIVIHSRKLGESSFLVTLFSKDLGKIKGMVRVGKKNAANIQMGNIVRVDWKRRLSSQLGTFVLEVIRMPVAKCFANPTAMQSLHYLSEVLVKGMEDEEPHLHLYEKTVEFLDTLNEPNVWERLAFYELNLLVSLGYGLSLTKEKAVPCEENSPLMYVSPKSGRAVSEVTGAPYKGQLLTLPALFGGKTPENRPKSEEFLDVFSLTGHFLDKAVHGKRLKEREQLVDIGHRTNFE